MGRALARIVLAGAAAALAGCGEAPAPPASAAPATRAPPLLIIPPFSPPRAATSEPEAPDPPETAAPPVCPAPDPDRRPIGGPWVTFQAPPYTGDSGPASGPDWSFRTPRLPAISRDGKRLLSYAADPTLGASPGVVLVVQRVSDMTVVSRTPLLDEAAFAKAHEAGFDVAARRPSYDALKETTAAHVAEVNARLEAEGWSQLEACRIDIGAGDTQPGCSMKDQEIRCGAGLRLRYAEPQLDMWAGGWRRRLRDPRWISPPAKGGGDVQVAVRGCIGAAWLDAARGLLVARFAYACHGAGGDWCSPADVWRALPVGPARPAPAPAPAAPVAGSACPSGMAAIPGGHFTMGSSRDVHEEPRRPMDVAAFCLDTREVTVADYAACLTAGGCFAPDVARWAGPGTWSGASDDGCNWGARGRESHPMNCVAWSFARAYCAWAGKRLPTAAEWEFGGRGPEGRTYPWGESAPGAGVCWNAKPWETCPAGASPADATPLGVLDLAGNVREWTSDPPLSGNGCWEDGGFEVRGGSAGSTEAKELHAARRDGMAGEAHYPDLGFRCAASR